MPVMYHEPHFPLMYILDARPPNAMPKAVFAIKRQWVLSSDYQVGWTNFPGQTFSMAYARHRPSTSVVSSAPCRCQSLSVGKQACVLVSTVPSITGVLSERRRG